MEWLTWVHLIQGLSQVHHCVGLPDAISRPDWEICFLTHVSMRLWAGPRRSTPSLLTWLLAGFRSSMAIGQRYHFFFFLPYEPLNSFTYNMAPCFFRVRALRKRATKTDVTNFCCLISEAASQHILFLLLRIK